MDVFSGEPYRGNPIAPPWAREGGTVRASADGGDIWVGGDSTTCIHGSVLL